MRQEGGADPLEMLKKVVAAWEDQLQYGGAYEGLNFSLGDALDEAKAFLDERGIS
jgi:hypothetical protein